MQKCTKNCGVLIFVPSQTWVLAIIFVFMDDSFLFQGKRKELVEVLVKKNITDQAVLKAIGKIPRHLFMDRNFEHFAYDDKAFQIGAGQTISQPYTVAFQTSLLELKRFDKVLEIGTGSGYQASVLAECGAKVYSIERQKTLYLKTKPFLLKCGYLNIKCFYGDGFAGLPRFAPFDKILITAAAPHIPEELIKQLKVGGCLVIPLNEEDSTKVQTMIRLTKIDETRIHREEFEQFRFVPMLQGKAE